MRLSQPAEYLFHMHSKLIKIDMTILEAQLPIKEKRKEGRKGCKKGMYQPKIQKSAYS